MSFDEIDLKILLENFDEETISRLDYTNLQSIMVYLNKNGIYYAKDLLISSLGLFLLPADTFIKQFEKLKAKLGNNYVEKLACDEGLIETMYED